MTNVITFPCLERVEVTHGTDIETAHPVHVFELVRGGVRTGVGYFFTGVEAAQCAADWMADRIDVIWKRGGTA